MKDIDWNDLRVVLALSRAGSLTKAARLLGLDQTTIGRRLSGLEADLGTTLFVRSKAGFLPTDDGRQVIERAAKIEEQVTRMTETLASPEVGASGVVRVMGNTWMLERLAGRVPELLREHPTLELRFSGRLPPAPLHGETTLSFWFDAQARAPDVARPFARVPYAAFTSSETDIPPHDWVQFRDDDATGPSFSRAMRRRLGPEAEVKFMATDARILMAAIRAGVGHGVLPLCLGQETPGLRPSSTDIGRIDRVLHCHMNPDTVFTARVRAVMEWLTNVLPDTLGATLIQPPDRAERRSGE